MSSEFNGNGKEFKKKKDDEIRKILESNETVIPKLGSMVAVSAERASMSILLNCPEQFHKIVHSLQPDDFTNIVNRRLLEIVVEVSEKKNNGNYVTPEQILYEESFAEEMKKLQAHDYIDTLRQVKYPSESLDKLIKILKTKRVQRDYWAMQCETMQRLLNFEGEEISDVLSLGMNDYFQIVQDMDDSVFDIYTYGDKLSERLREREANPVKTKGFSLSWFPAFTEITNGLTPAELIVGAARPKHGKSILLNEFAVNLGIIGSDPKNPGKDTISVGYVDSEMENEQQENRAMSQLSGVEELKISNGLYMFNDIDHKKVLQAEQLMKSQQNVHWRRIPVFDTKQIITAFKILRVVKGIKVGFFDQIKDTTDPVNPASEKEHQRIGWLAMALKLFAEREKMPIVAMMQLSRGGTDGALRKEKVDPATVFADSDRVLRFASKCFYLAFMDRAEQELFGGPQKAGNTVLNMFANRSGDSHDPDLGIGLSFRKRITRFDEMGPLKVAM